NINYALEHMNEYEMIVLDELFVAVGYGLVDIEAVKRIVRTYGGELVMTGRNPDEWFLKKADYISEIKNIRHPYDKGVAARRGIEY
ncbi:MAG: cob(I)yrinic acid a,c-diamide adenosyltransferase, partial [Clostridia bacterium]|nr:cob(I)yrinic acid a,c-diamide adenosyltransferase [Clostridia bacterium]